MVTQEWNLLEFPCRHSKLPGQQWNPCLLLLPCHGMGMDCGCT